MGKNKNGNNIQKQLLEAMDVSGKMKVELKQVKVQNDYLEGIINRMEQIVLGGRS